MWPSPPGAFGVDDVSRETRQRLDRYAALLLRWNSRINLIGRADESELWQRHIADSLQLVPLVDHSLPAAIDIGSGAGFPGLVLAIATNVPFHLVESDKRKASFLQEAARVADAPVTIHPVRAEGASLSPVPLITARAVAPLTELLALAHPLLAQGGMCLFPKGRGAENELTRAQRDWHMRVQRFASQTDPGSVIFCLTEVARS